LAQGTKGSGAIFHLFVENLKDIFANAGKE